LFNQLSKQFYAQKAFKTNSLRSAKSQSHLVCRKIWTCHLCDHGVDSRNELR